MILFKIVEIWQVLYFTVDSCLVLNCLLFNFVCSSMSFQCSWQFCMVLYVLVQFWLVIHNLVSILYLVQVFFGPLFVRIVQPGPRFKSQVHAFDQNGTLKCLLTTTSTTLLQTNAKELTSPFPTQNTTLNRNLQGVGNQNLIRVPGLFGG